MTPLLPTLAAAIAAAPDPEAAARRALEIVADWLDHKALDIGLDAVTAAERGRLKGAQIGKGVVEMGDQIIARLRAAAKGAGDE